MSTTLAPCDSPAAPFALHRELSWSDRWARRLVAAKLARLQGGRLTLSDRSGRQTFGAAPPADADDLHCTLEIRDPSFYRHAVLGGSLSVAESYIRGQWDCDDLTAFFRLFVRNLPIADGVDRGVSRLAGWGAAAYHRWHANSKSGSRRNIHLHYDLGNEFFARMLDETMSYSSGYFADSQTSLVDASIAKIDRICRKLELRPTDRLLEIGAGWGGFAIHAARHYGCHVTTTTISTEQFDLANQRIRAAGLSDRIQVLLQDYRDLEGEYDKLVSIEMIEAVGHAWLDAYFGACGRLLRPDGTFVLQAIVMGEQRHRQYLRSVDFIQRYVFPGGCLPTVATMTQSVGRATDMRAVQMEDFGLHYAETLRRWRGRFHDRIAEIRSLGYGESFLRMWEYYLCYCEAAFEERYIGVVQMQWDKPGRRRAPAEASDLTPKETSSWA